MTHEQISTLVVGDRYAYTGEIEAMLRHTRWSNVKANSVADAIATLAKKEFDVVLCQKTLEDGAWLEVLQAVRKHNPHAAIIVLSKGNDTLMTDLSLGAYDVLPVPCNALELYSTVTSAWRHFMRQQQPAAAGSKHA